MHYKLSLAPSAAAEQQAGELERLVRLAAPVVVEFATVAGAYKPVRVRLALVTVPDRLAAPALQGLRSLYAPAEHEQAVVVEQAVRQRTEWRHAALFLPVDPGAPALDGRLLDGWDSACLTVQYLPSRAAATLVCCVEDAGRLAKLAPEGWQRRDLPVLPPALLAAIRQGLARRWTGVPSLLPVPGAATPPRRAATPATAAATTTEMATTTAAPATDPLDTQARDALTEAEDGLVLGVGRDGSPVRLARRAQLLSLVGPEASLKSAVLALVTRAMQARISVVLAVSRSVLPQAVLMAWEERVRWFDIQRPQDSATLRWRAIAPDLLADALGVEPALLPPPLPARFGALLEQIDASDLRIAPLLTLTAGPGDDLHQVLRAGGLIVVPQDGDVASELVARLVLAALATPPELGCGLLLLLDPALAVPPTLAAQALQAVIGSREDALLRLEADAAGWQLRSRSGGVLADIQADLLLDASGGRPDLIQTVLNALGASEMPLDPMGGAKEREEEAGPEAILDEEPLSWGAIPDEGGDPDDVDDEETGAILAEEGVGGGDPVGAGAILAGEGVEGGDLVGGGAIRDDEGAPPAPSEADPALARAILAGEDGERGGDPEPARAIPAEEARSWEAILVEEGVGGGDPLAGAGGDPEPAGAIPAEEPRSWEAILADAAQGGGDPAALDGGALLMEGDPVTAEAEEPPSARDEALDALLTVLLELSAATEAEAHVQATVADENWTLAELAVRAWLLEQAHDARPWAWLAVLVADDRERADAARQALIRRPDPALLPALRTVLEVLEGEEAPDLALLVELAQGADVAAQEGDPGLEVGDPAPSLPDLGLSVVAERERAPGLAPLADPAVSQLEPSWAWPAVPVGPGDSGLPAPDAQDQVPVETGDPPGTWFPFAFPDPAAGASVSGAILEERGDLAAAPVDPLTGAEPILGLPAWVPLEPVAPWGDPGVREPEAFVGIGPDELPDPPFPAMPAAGSPLAQGGDPGLGDVSAPAAPWGDPGTLEREAPARIAPTELPDPPLQALPAAGLPLAQGSDPGLSDAPVVERLDDTALIRAWQEGATSAELVAQLVAAGVERAQARQRVRAILRAGAETPAAPSLPAAHLVEPPDRLAPALGLPDPALATEDRPRFDLSLPLADPGLGQGDPAQEAGDLLPTGGTVWSLAALPDPAWERGDPVLGLSDPALAAEDRPALDQGDPALERGDPAPASGTELLTSKGVAEILGCQDGYVRKLISSGRLPAKKDAKGFNRVARADVLAYQQQLAERG